MLFCIYWIIYFFFLNNSTRCKLRVYCLVRKLFPRSGSEEAHSILIRGADPTLLQFRLLFIYFSNNTIEEEMLDTES